MANRYDLIILGAGPAGLSAGVYAARYGLKALVIGKESGGKVSETTVVENYLGFPSITGAELTQKFQDHAKKAGAELLLLKNLTELKKTASGFEVKIDGQSFAAGALIIALGTERRKLNIPGEKELEGKGVSYCVTCDGPLFKDKVTGVVGGRNAAVTAALFLAKRCKKVYIIYRQDKLRADPVLTKRVLAEKKIEIIFSSVPVKVNGDQSVTSVTIDQKGKKSDLKLDGLFVEIGATPVTELVSRHLKIKLNEQGHIMVKHSMATNVQGVFAAGDITDYSNNLWQIATAVGEGAIAANSAFKYLRKIKY